MTNNASDKRFKYTTKYYISNFFNFRKPFHVSFGQGSVAHQYGVVLRQKSEIG